MPNSVFAWARKFPFSSRATASCAARTSQCRRKSTPIPNWHPRLRKEFSVFLLASSSGWIRRPGLQKRNLLPAFQFFQCTRSGALVKSNSEFGRLEALGIPGPDAEVLHTHPHPDRGSVCPGMHPTFGRPGFHIDLHISKTRSPGVVESDLQQKRPRTFANELHFSDRIS